MEDWRKDARREPILVDAEKPAMRVIHTMGGLAAVTRWGRLKFAAMSLKKQKIRS